MPPRARGTRIARIARWVASAVLVGVVIVVLLTFWLLRSGGGRDFALARVLASLPANSLSWREAQGTLAGPLLLRGVRFEHEGLIVEVDRAEVDLAPLALTSRLLQIEHLSLLQGRVVLPPGDDAPQPWPRRVTLPERLPEMELPLAIALDALALRAIRIEQGELSLLDLERLDAAGRFERGRVALERLDLDSDKLRLRADGALDTASRWDTGLAASVELLDLGTEPLPLQLDARGDWRDLTIVAKAALTSPATATLRIHGGLPDPQWQLQLDAPHLDPQRFGSEGEPIALQLVGEGDLGRATLHGEFAQGERSLRLDPSTLRLDDGIVHVEPLSLGLRPGTVQATGQVDLRGAAPVFALDIEAKGLELAADAADAIVHVDANGRIEGPSTDYGANLDAQLHRAEDRAELSLLGRGNEQDFQIEALTLDSAHGDLRAQGAVAWAPQAAWTLNAQLHGFDPSWIAPEFPGAVDASIVSEGRVEEGGARGTAKIDALGGTLRGRALGGEVTASFAPAGGRGEADLRLGDSRIAARGRWGDTLDLSADLKPLQLADALPQASGSVRGRIALSGRRAAPDIDAELEGAALRYGGTHVGALNLRVDVQGADRGEVGLRAQDLEFAGQHHDSLVLLANGSRGEHRAMLALQGGPAHIELELQGGEREGRWRGLLQQLALTPRERDTWRLRAPAELAFDQADAALKLSQACLTSAQASLCAEADWSDQGGDVALALEALPLATFDPFIVEALAAPASAYGTLSGNVSLQRDASGMQRGQARFTSTEGGLRLDPDAPRDWLMYRDLDLTASLTPEQATLRSTAQLGADGEFELDLSSADPTASDGPVQGHVRARLRDLTFLELFSDALVSPRGALDADLAVAGTRAAPQLQGSAQLREFSGELPALGLTLSKGRVALRSQGATAAEIEGEVSSGEGRLTLSGRFDPQAEERMSLELRGENFTAVSIPEVNAVASPNLSVQVREKLVRLRGEVVVPRARIELEHLQSTTSPSSDAVVIDDERDDDAGALALDSDVSVTLGEDVRLNGFGLKGKLEGKLGLRDRPGRASVARGAIDVDGEYKAYGQDLDITRGRLSYASTPIDDPALDIRAQREIDTVTVGVQVRGTALAPQLTLWSDPALDQAEQLSYLVLGRPLRSASQADGAQLSQAAAAFGGNLLAQKLGARMGLDEVGVADSRALGGAALTVGKYLSPKLYVSYGVALFGPGQVVTFKYLLSRVWSVQIDSGTENRAALNYRLER